MIKKINRRDSKLLYDIATIDLDSVRSEALKAILRDLQCKKRIGKRVDHFSSRKREKRCSDQTVEELRSSTLQFMAETAQCNQTGTSLAYSDTYTIRYDDYSDYYSNYTEYTDVYTVKYDNYSDYDNDYSCGGY